MSRRLLSFLVIVMATGCLSLTPREQRIILEAGATSDWMIIEWSNQRCTPLVDSSPQLIHIPADGDFCTSTPQPRFLRAEYFVLDGSTTRPVGKTDKLERSDSTIDGRRLTFIEWIPAGKPGGDTTPEAVARHFKRFPDS